jgi:hypothetical protein
MNKQNNRQSERKIEEVKKKEFQKLGLIVGISLSLTLLPVILGLLSLPLIFILTNNTFGKIESDVKQLDELAEENQEMKEIKDRFRSIIPDYLSYVQEGEAEKALEYHTAEFSRSDLNKLTSNNRIFFRHDKISYGDFTIGETQSKVNVILFQENESSEFIFSFKKVDDNWLIEGINKKI